MGDKGVTDIHGKTFTLAVNSEHKATECGPSTCCARGPHMHTFWAATIGFFCTFFSCFAPGALGAFYGAPREMGGLGLTGTEKSDAGAYAVTGTILMRVLAGPMCDKFGARLTFVFLLLIGIPGMLIFSLADGAVAFMIGRIIIGLSLATFVTCQVWCSQFFDRSIVGTVNATAGGWGNLGGGITLLLMPQIMEIFLAITGNNINTSWRLCMIVPVVMHLFSAIIIYIGRDLPDGSYKELEERGMKQKSKGAGNVAVIGFSNTNAWIMLVTYGLCFGVELCMNNKLVPYFVRYYAFPTRVAGPLGACFSLMNLFARSWGGLLSDFMNKKFGMRGRITAMWVVQTIEGVFCILMGLVTVEADGPDEPGFFEDLQTGVYMSDGTTYTMTNLTAQIGKCSSRLINSPAEALVDGALVSMPGFENGVTPDPIPLIVIHDPGSTCVHNQGTLGLTMLMMIFFSVCVQMAEGLHFGIVPYISRPALGVVSGMVGAGGNAGALISSKTIGGKNFDSGFIGLGVAIIAGSLSMFGIFFPGEGGIILPKTFPYNPQLIKPAEGQKGSDEVDFSKEAEGGTSTAEVEISKA